ncbi:guanosine diphosphatase Ecym_3567 [Eremothecium cymbalariae DBVPG|uniref:guanosine-diphosphatase n=1 Tax=Eremothecium cymbalariae (strain CBS 270.75 / DBVPG 7215 / KCTC 17166 / NRRL Y-17582) TaxID=931890 RepID=G8JQQ4_ERECY|nr:Hypothetical protein Ecym_3567 [Eremothecium cymbalariae DBVPG\
MTVSIHGIFRNYRFVIGALTAMMLVLLLRSSSTGVPIQSSKAVEQPVNIQPVTATPGYLEDKDSESKNPEVAAAVKSQAVKTSQPEIKVEDCKKNQFVVMIDAGSTGSRVHVYEFNTCVEPPKLLKEYFKQLKPGLSSFDTDADGAAKSLDPLLDFAVENIPKDMRRCSPIAVKATAGLRLLGEEKSKKILEAVALHLEKDYDFPIVKGDGVSVMDGKEEGVYAWITTNFLLGNLGGKEKSATAAIFDLGGGSTQIVFEPLPEAVAIPNAAQTYELEFGTHKYTLYQHSHLGYGLMQAKDKLDILIVETNILNGNIKKGATSDSLEMVSPCLAPGVEIKNVKVKVSTGETYTVTFKSPPVSMEAQCRYLADKILKKDAACNDPPCSFDGIHQPSLIHSFSPNGKLYVFSFFYDRTYPLGLPLSYSLQEMFDLTKSACMDKSTWDTTFGSIEGASKSLNTEPRWCMDLNYEISLLHTGYDIPLSRELNTARTIAGKEVGWCLGASLLLLDGNKWTCKIKLDTGI